MWSHLQEMEADKDVNNGEGNDCKPRSPMEKIPKDSESFRVLLKYFGSFLVILKEFREVMIYLRSFL